MKNMNACILNMLFICCAQFTVASEIFAMCYMPELDHKLTGRQAIDEDVDGVVDLINNYAEQDHQKIVLVPKKFRRDYIQDAVTKKRLFVACLGNRIIAYKKLFCVTDEQELDDLLSNELRIKGTNPVVSGVCALPNLVKQNIVPEVAQLVNVMPVTYVYTGADFTYPGYRGMGINPQLTKYALNAVTETVVKEVAQRKSTHLALINGLVFSNAGKEDDLLGGRMGGIVRAFMPFASAVAQASGCAAPCELMMSRHYAFKPTFDPEAQECKPLPEKESVPGYGCLVACALKRAQADEAGK